jgi:alkylation response protein AidB-like acyl-CoA dehydrogenase
VLFQNDDGRRVMGFLPCQHPGLTLVEQQNFVGMNATATCTCQFQDVRLPSDYVLSESGDEMVASFRQAMVLTQVGVALGLARAAIADMKHLRASHGEINSFLKVQPEELEPRFTELDHKADQLSQAPTTPATMKEIFQVRLAAAYLALEAAQAGMLHSGGSGYLAGSAAARRLREAHFLAIVTPSIKHLEKILHK